MKTCHYWASKTGGSHFEFLNKMALISVNNIIRNNSSNVIRRTNSYRILRDHTFIHTTYLDVWLCQEEIRWNFCVEWAQFFTPVHAPYSDIQGLNWSRDLSTDSMLLQLSVTQSDHSITQWSTFPCLNWIIYIGGSRGRARRAPPLRVQILSFWHAKFSKHSRLGGPQPPYEVHGPPTGNPGSATDLLSDIPTFLVEKLGYTFGKIL